MPNCITKETEKSLKGHKKDLEKKLRKLKMESSKKITELAQEMAEIEVVLNDPELEVHGEDIWDCDDVRLYPSSSFGKY